MLEKTIKRKPDSARRILFDKVHSLKAQFGQIKTVLGATLDELIK